MVDAKFAQGRDLLQHPVGPLVSMVHFLFMTGPFATVAEVIDELPEPIETDKAKYARPRRLLREYLDILCRYDALKKGNYPSQSLVDEQGDEVDGFTVGTYMIQQEILARELERINSVLCGPCGCTLCCVGPETGMEHEFFEIPLAAAELDLFSVSRCDNEASRCRQAAGEDELHVDGKPFYRTRVPGLFHWQNGWSLILPRESRCPNLDTDGQCMVYGERPDVCRRPQVFPYMIEPLDNNRDDKPSYRIRQSLLAVIDCPYVRALQDEIAEYAAASSLHLVVKQNKI